MLVYPAAFGVVFTLCNKVYQLWRESFDGNLRQQRAARLRMRNAPTYNEFLQHACELQRLQLEYKLRHQQRFPFQLSSSQDQHAKSPRNGLNPSTDLAGQLRAAEQRGGRVDTSAHGRSGHDTRADSRLYDVSLLRNKVRLLRETRKRGDVNDMIFVLRADLHRDLANMSNR